MARRQPGEAFTEFSYLCGVLTKPSRPPLGAGLSYPANGGPTGPPSADASPLDRNRSRRRVLLGRLAAVFYVGCAVLVLVTLPLPAPGAQRAALVLVCVAALAVAVVIWLAPWDRWPQRAGLVIIPPAFALIALRNTFGGSDLHTYSVFFVVAFVWVGLAQPPRASLLLAPLAAAAYILPLLMLPGDVDAGLASAVITIGVCVLVGEGIAWGMVKLEQLEGALHRERYRSEQLRELHDMKDEFLSAASHELRTPLTICRGHLDVLETGASEHEVRAVKQTLTDELDLMGRLVDDLTTLARAGDRVLLKVEALSLDDFVASVVTMAEPILVGRLLVEYEPSDTIVHADPLRLTQALLNLLQNAAEHAIGYGPVRLRVGAQHDSWLFEVADEGGGLARDQEQFVFEPFRTASRLTGRTGLGLSIVREIAKAHDGDCGVVNRPGRGATFWIRIPR